MKDFLTIKFGIGLGNLNFGDSYEEVRNCLGKADDDIEDNDTRVWYFRSIGVNVYFSTVEGNVITGFETYNPKSILWGNKIFNMNLQDLLMLFHKKVGFPSEKKEYNDGDISFTFDSLECVLYFESNKLDSIQWSPFFDSSGDNFIWPTKKEHGLP
jgi:hypothetical protein